MPPAMLQGEAFVEGLHEGQLPLRPTTSIPGRGRQRRWWYAAFASEDGATCLGAAVARVGPIGTAFAWLAVDGKVHELARRGAGPSLRVGASPRGGGSATARDLRLGFDGHGGLHLVAASLGGHAVSVQLRATPTTPVVCSTRTPNGGWNLTEKSAGHRLEGDVVIDGSARPVAGAGWYDWTWGRQDRRTWWRWAAAAGRDVDGRPVGLNLSTGMNGSGPTENVVWLGGRPSRVELDVLGPDDDQRFEGPWTVAGPDWALEFTPIGHRSAREELVVVRSSYVQPIGSFSGTLPAPDGTLVRVEGLPGVTEDHRALW